MHWHKYKCINTNTQIKYSLCQISALSNANPTQPEIKQISIPNTKTVFFYIAPFYSQRKTERFHSKEYKTRLIKLSEVKETQKGFIRKVEVVASVVWHCLYCLVLVSQKGVKGELLSGLSFQTLHKLNNTTEASCQFFSTLQLKK